ncbi:hydrogenase expression protein [Natrarchaeobius halalkaliphilus]|uniref:Hydrogenase expression protein n=1 Tax=Natrarchaeobius halalkaliphilus TaxID=1679091 RepID=A0A3N6N097_9EURY|nr:AIR synthase family protein [Natrarchaeobius halalkaliphilus]RQG91302.1 hydrogenase expression protein [Natrarchaeobius halalkaliphilus]
MPGKVPPDELLAHVFDRTDSGADETILQGPAEGEDAAVIDWPGGDLVVSSDPISLAASQVGTLGVYVACNDVAASGADPRWLTVVVLLPGSERETDGLRHSSDGDVATGETLLETIMTDLEAAAADVGATIVGGHSEYVDQIERPLISLTAMGATDSFVRTGGAEPGDAVILTKAPGIEGTAILAADFGDTLDVDDAIRDRAEQFLAEISVVPDARAVREYATAMHDPTEGGVAAGLLEIARASNVRLEIDREAVTVRPETEALCAAAGVDPLCIFGSGALLATVPQAALGGCLDTLTEAGVEATAIGTVGSGEPELRLDSTSITEPIEDDLYPLWEAVDE